MNIVLLGATGKTGVQLLQQSLEAGHIVKAIVRTPSKVTTTHPNLSVLAGDVTNSQSLAEAMVGSDVLMSVLGNNKGTLIADSTKAIIAAADISNMKRVIILSSFAVEVEKLQPFAKFMTSMILKNMVADKTAGEAVLRSSNLDWTIVYATALTNGSKDPTAKIISSDEKLGMKNKISRAATAAWMLEEAKIAKYVRQSVTISQ